MIQLICLIVAIYVNVRLWQSLAEPPCKENNGLLVVSVLSLMAVLVLTLGLLLSMLGPPSSGFSTIPVKIMERWY